MSTALATVAPAAVERTAFDQIKQYAEVVFKSRLFPGISTVEQASAVMLLCDSDGIHPMQAVRRFHFMKMGDTVTISMKADAMSAEFKRLGGKIKWLEMTDDRVSATFHIDGEDSPVIMWDNARCKQAGLSNLHYKFPQQMKTARVISQGIRLMAPGIICGIYTPEEIADFESPEILTAEETRQQFTPLVTVATPAATTPKQPVSTVIGDEITLATNPASAGKIPPTLYELVMKAQLTTKVIKGFIFDATTGTGHVDADALEALMTRCIEAITKDPTKADGMSAVWSPYADTIRNLCPELDGKLTAMGCPAKAPESPAPEEDTPFGDVQEKSPADLALEAFETEFMRDDCPGSRYSELYKKMTVAAGGVENITKAHTDRCVELRKLKASK